MKSFTLSLLCFLIVQGITAQEAKYTIVQTPHIDFSTNRLEAMTNEKEIYAYESQFSVNETITRLQNELKEMEIPIFALFDHQDNAKSVGLQMNPSKVIVFGSPKVGTTLMQQNPSIALALPLKIAVYQDANGSVWTTFTKMKFAGKTYPLEDDTILKKMDELLEKLTIKASSIF